MNKRLNDLSPLKRMFVLEYLKDFVAKKAAERLNLDPAAGHRYLGETAVQEAIAEQIARRTEETQIDADWVLIQLGRMFNADLADLFHPGTNDLKPVHEWPEIWRRMSTAIRIDDKNGKYQVKDVKILDRLKALELIGKHTNVKAFQDRVELTTSKQLADRLVEGRRRAHQRNSAAKSSGLPSFL